MYQYVGPDLVPHEGAAPVIQRILEEKKLRRGNITTDLGKLGTGGNSCEFCGEGDHAGPECYNLCAVCGEYGHFKSACDRVPENRIVVSESDPRRNR